VADRLRRLPEPLKGHREEPQRVDVAIVGLEADLELGQRPLLVVAGEVHLGQLFGQLEVVRLEGR
jgi:hypothetical protein